MLTLVPRAPSAPRLQPGAMIGAPLAALDGQRFSGRFQVWRTQNGERLVCTVFDAGDDGAFDCLEVADAAIVIGVWLDRFGLARALSVLDPDDLARRDLAATRALWPAIHEWHIHLLARTPDEARRRAAGLRALARL